MNRVTIDNGSDIGLPTYKVSSVINLMRPAPGLRRQLCDMSHKVILIPKEWSNQPTGTLIGKGRDFCSSNIGQ